MGDQRGAANGLQQPDTNHATHGSTGGADEIARRLSELLDRCKGLQDSASAHSSRFRRDAEALTQEALALDCQIKLLEGDLNSATDRGHMSQQLADKIEEDLYRARSMIHDGDVGALLPCKSNGLFLRLLLGPVNVRAPRSDVRLQVKQEYNAFRDRTAILFLAFPSILLILNFTVWNGCVPALPVQAYQAWLLYFYVSLALRENILRVNGSDILPWWVYHHYFAMFMALVSLTWGIQGTNACVRKQQGVRLFLAWAVMQGIAMLLQNRYQRRRLYTRIALGKTGRMDVVWGETAGVKGQIWLLYPLLFTLQAFQFSIGLLLLRTAFYEEDSEWQIVACGILLIIMALGNFSNTVTTVVAKSRMKARRRRRERNR